jgi:hypothetical protein
MAGENCQNNCYGCTDYPTEKDRKFCPTVKARRNAVRRGIYAMKKARDNK